MHWDKPWSLLSPFLPALVLVGALGTTSFGTERMEEPAFQGHAAEMQLRTEGEERRRRALFFDAVDRELGTPGLPCDHLVKSKPQSVAGLGYVVVLAADGNRFRMRAWFPPGAAASLDDASGQARAAATAMGSSELEVADLKSFMWCR